MTGRAPGITASPTRPVASRAAPPRTTTVDGAGRHQRPTIIPERQRADQHGALQGAVAPHLDRQEDAEEQRADEGREDECEPDVGDDDVAPPGVGGAVDVAFAAQRARAAGSTATTTAPATIGACTKKIARQSKSSVRSPPSAGPTAVPIAPASAHHRRARLVPSSAGGTTAPSTGSDPASRNVAPTPWTARATSSIGSDDANPAASDADANTATPATTSDSGRTRRWRSATGTATTATARA